MRITQIWMSTLHITFTVPCMKWVGNCRECYSSSLASCLIWIALAITFVSFNINAKDSATECKCAFLKYLYTLGDMPLRLKGTEWLSQHRSVFFCASSFVACCWRVLSSEWWQVSKIQTTHTSSWVGLVDKNEVVCGKQLQEQILTSFPTQ